MRFSYSMLSRFLDCPFSYKRIYIDKAETPDNISAVFGIVVHKTIHTGYSHKLEKADWLKVFKRNWIIAVKSRDALFATQEEFVSLLKEGQYMLSKFYDKYVKDVPFPIATEHRFNNITLGNHTLVGIIDAITHDNEVIDFKTGKYIPKSLELSLDLQFTVYSYAFRQLYNKDEKALVLLNLRSNKKYLTYRTDSDYQVLETILDGVEIETSHKNFYKRPGRHCEWCPFMSECWGRISPRQSMWSKSFK